MSGTTRTAQQPLVTNQLPAALAVALIVLVAAVAMAWGSSNLARTAPAPLAAPAAISDPMLRDLGARDLGAASVSIGATHGAPGAYRPVATSGGSSTLVKDDIIGGSSQGAPATRHAGLRAQ